jgi:hypothetical protein
MTSLHVEPDAFSIDHSTGTPILMHNNCSVIESEVAELVMQLIANHRTQPPAEDANPAVDGSSFADLEDSGVVVKRLRRLLSLLGISAPESDESLLLCSFSLLGMACRKIEQLNASSTALDVAGAPPAEAKPTDSETADLSNCEVCGNKVLYGSRHHQCGTYVMARDREADLLVGAAYLAAAKLIRSLIKRWIKDPDVYRVMVDGCARDCARKVTAWPEWAALDIRTLIHDDARKALEEFAVDMVKRGMSYEEANHEAGDGEMDEAARAIVHQVLSKGGEL